MYGGLSNTKIFIHLSKVSQVTTCMHIQGTVLLYCTVLYCTALHSILFLRTVAVKLTSKQHCRFAGEKKKDSSVRSISTRIRVFVWIWYDRSYKIHRIEPTKGSHHLGCVSTLLYRREKVSALWHPTSPEQINCVSHQTTKSWLGVSLGFRW